MAHDTGSGKLSTRAEIEQSFERLLERVASYRPTANCDLLRRAFSFAAEVHDGQQRQSGEPYIAHPLQACHILADIEADEWSLAACLLHDTVEDCAQDEEREVKRLRRELEELESPKSKRAAELRAQIEALEHVVERLKDEVGQQLAEEFGTTVAALVDGVTRLSEVRFFELAGHRRGAGESAQSEQVRRRLQAENFRRMVVAAARDVRVLVIKLADRLHNMQTLYAKRREKQIKIARESEVIYAKLAGRIGIWRIKWEMEDLALRYLNPEGYFEVESMVHKTREERMAEIETVSARIRAELEAADVPAQVHGRPKHLYSIYHKMQSQGIDFESIHDLQAIRIITDTVWHCYKCLSIVHGIWPHKPEQLADYISNPKRNGYQSIHTKVVTAHGAMEIQIRTHDMHRKAEYGVAAHWRYKDDGVIAEPLAKQMDTLRLLFEMAREAPPASPTDEAGVSEQDDFLTVMESELWEEEGVFAFSPQGELIDLPKGATVVDFAYRIHTEVGHSCIGARVDGRMVPLNYRIQNGQVVEILRQKNSGPSRDWMQFVTTAGARNRIRQYFRRKEHDNLLDRGQRRLDEAAVRMHVNLQELYQRDRNLPAHYRRRRSDQPTEDVLTRIARRRSFNTAEDLLIAIGDGLAPAEGIIRQMVLDVDDSENKGGLHPAVDGTAASPALPVPRSDAAVSLNGMQDLMFRRSKCCLPIPGDEICGYTTRGSGIAIHRQDCANIRYLREKEPDRIVDLSWEQTGQHIYDVKVELWANDRKRLLGDLGNLIAEFDLNITGIQTKSPKSYHAGIDHLAIMELSLEIQHRSQLERLFRRLPGLGVIKIMVGREVYHDAEKGTRGRTSRVRTRPRAKSGRPS